MGFTALGLSAPILRAIQEQGYVTPLPIQLQAIPAVLEGHDVMAVAQTGTGKTAGFTLPILECLRAGSLVKNNHIRVLILAPTRELAAQINENVIKYSRYLRVSTFVVFGGVKINPQKMRLRQGSDILVATPGRLIDLYNQNAVKFSQLEVLVLDEADRMLDMGFILDIRRILNMLPKQRQNLLFSATFSDEIRELAKGLVNEPVEISVTPVNSTATTVEQCIYPVDKGKKAFMLVRLIKDGNWRKVLVFSRTKQGANKLAHYLNDQGIAAASIHGNKSQGARTRALADFKSGQVRVLVATDIAARGIDIPQLPQVVNFDLPSVSEDYVHRIGRTGRAGESGKAISLVCADEAIYLFSIERLIKQVLPRIELVNFTLSAQLPELKLDTTPIKARRPTKSKLGSSDKTRSGENAHKHKSIGINQRNLGSKRKKSIASGSRQGGNHLGAEGQNISGSGKAVQRHRVRTVNKSIV
ncbi:DEAD/DEAH box helicase [Candidatus Enterovibrio escicola]|uniref:DEAD/DEAH box helicase n=1 Tax=Candidatus Enterovibrio escicola TaxID=1927127 RepID=UPI00123809EC|nr:DEAD/DEAH box helicase [Candidatus Enterovibrio escacola]